MTRHPEWERRLNAVIAKHRDLPGEWGVSDCWMLAMDAYAAVTDGELLPALRGYTTERDGYKLFAKHGFTTVGEALGSVLPSIGRFSAKRGDLAVVERNGIESCCVVWSPQSVSKPIIGLAYVSMNEIKRAFQVE